MLSALRCRKKFEAFRETALRELDSRERLLHLKERRNRKGGKGSAPPGASSASASSSSAAAAAVWRTSREESLYFLRVSYQRVE